MSIYIKYIYLRYIYLYNIYLYIEEFSAGKAPREFEFENCARSLCPSREKRSQEYRVKRTTEPLRHADTRAVGMFYEICGISRDRLEKNALRFELHQAR